ncbi:MAG: hypothetical protein HPY55_09015 [Firmicutes bacterium]|nr:hypothetical protein [Bacillota bacterium]
MGRKKRLNVRVATVAVTLLCLSLIPSTVLAEGDPWYTDVAGHWAQEYVRTLWEEDVTDGKIEVVRRDGRRRRESRYYPSLGCTRGQYSMMLAKAFRLSPDTQGPPAFADVPEGYSIFDKPAFCYVQAAARAGIIVGYPDGCFVPEVTITREQAFVILVRALGLESYARQLSDDEVWRLLRRFRDRNSVSGGFVKELAVAVKLKIVEGYPDGTLRPRQNVTRAEAATVVYRSCMVTASVNPIKFSPDGDGVNDTTEFHLATLRNRNAIAWNLFVTDYSGQLLRTMNHLLDPGPPPASLSWDGRADDRRVLPDGTYYYRARVEDRNRTVFWSVLKPVTLQSRGLWGHVSPPVVEPGDEAVVTAYAQGDPSAVLYASPWSQYQGLGRDGDFWRRPFRIPANTPDGEYGLHLRAVYDDTRRDTTTSVMVRQYVSVSGFLSPNPCRAGSTVTVTAYAPPCVIAVTASCDGLGAAGLSLRRVPGKDGEWTGEFHVPGDSPSGRYGVALTGRSLTKSAETTLYLTVDEPPLQTVGFVLVD